MREDRREWSRQKGKLVKPWKSRFRFMNKDREREFESSVFVYRNKQTSAKTRWVNYIVVHYWLHPSCRVELLGSFRIRCGWRWSSWVFCGLADYGGIKTEKPINFTPLEGRDWVTSGLWTIGFLFEGWIYMQNRIVAHVDDTKEMSIVFDDYGFKCSRAISEKIGYYSRRRDDHNRLAKNPEFENGSILDNHCFSVWESGKTKIICTCMCFLCKVSEWARRSCYAGSVSLPFIEKLFKLQ